MTWSYLIPCLKKLVGLGDFLRVSHLTSSSLEMKFGVFNHAMKWTMPNSIVSLGFMTIISQPDWFGPHWKIHHLPCKLVVRCSKLYPPWKPMECTSLSYKNGLSMGFHIPHCSSTYPRVAGVIFWGKPLPPIFQYVVKVALGIIQVAKWCKVMSRIHLTFGNTMVNKWQLHEKNDRHQIWFVFP